MNRDDRKNDSVPHWLYTEAVSKARPGLEREWSDLLRKEAASSPEMARLARAMFALRAERPAKPLLAPANAKALRWVDRRLRESRAAARLRAARPDLPLIRRIQLRFLRLSAPVLACLVAAMVQVRLFTVFDHVYRAGQKLASIHFDRHIGPMV